MLDTNHDPIETLADLDTRIAAFSNALPRAGAMAARRALARIAAANRTSLSSLPLDTALSRFEAIRGDVPVGCYGDEHTYLRQSLELPALPQDLIRRIREDRPTLADAAILVQMQGWDRKEKGRIKGALARLAKKLGVSMEQVPAKLHTVDDKLRQLSHADFALKKGSFDAFCTRVRRAVRLVDHRARQRLSRSLLTGPWRMLVEVIKSHPATGGDLGKLWPLVVYCHIHDMAPDQVTDTVIASVQEDLERQGRKNAFAVARDIVYAWERLQRLVSEFPRQELSRLYRPGHGSPHAVPFAKLPEALLRDWDAYEAKFFKPENPVTSLATLVVDTSDKAAAAKSRIDAMGRKTEKRRKSKRSRRAIANTKTVITYAANVAIAKGTMPQTIKELLAPDILREIIKIGIDRRLQRSPDEDGDSLARNSTFRNMAALFLGMACDLRVGRGALYEISRILDDVDPHVIEVSERADGKVWRRRTHVKIGPRHAARLRQFNDSAKFHAWHKVRRTLLEQAERRLESATKHGRALLLEDVNSMTACVLHHITRCCPARRQNLAELCILGPHQNVRLPSARGEGFIYIDWTKTKNRNDQPIALTPETVEVIRFYIEHFRPVLAKAVGADDANPYLFPAAGMKYRSPGLLNKAFRERNWDAAGIVLNLHVQRHVCAKVILDQDPSKMSLVQTILGHRDIETTKAYYAELNTIAAQRQFHKLIEISERQAASASIRGGR